jgi:gamma-glutamyltranspeptidase/glutathione hydrolase
VALYFTLAVTQPSTASLGGGAVCLVHSGDAKAPKTEVVDFSAPPSVAAGQARSPSAVPAVVRGLYAMHAKYGRLRWEQLLAEPERLARFGAPVSRAFAADLAKVAPLIARDPGMRRVFFHPTGRVLAEGDELQQIDLAVTLGRIRRSAGDFYSGTLAREMAQAATQAGLSLTAEELRDYRPAFRDTIRVKAGNEVAHFASGSPAAEAAATLFKAIADRPGERAQIMAQAEAHSQGVKAIMPATGFVILDHTNGAVACGLSTQGPFGNGRMLPGTGVVAAAAPGVSAPPPAVAPALLINPNVNEVRFGGAAAGGPEAPAALVGTLLSIYQDGKPLAQAMERAAPPNTPQAQLAPTRVNAFYCDSGAHTFKSCRVATDPRGFGLSVMVGKD